MDPFPRDPAARTLTAPLGEVGMNETLFALGRGIIKLFVSMFVGTGVGLLTFGINARDIDTIWARPGPPNEFFTAVGAGLLSAAIMMFVLFFVPRMFNAPVQAAVKTPVYDDELRS
jgi:hypothetical protein